MVEARNTELNGPRFNPRRVGLRGALALLVFAATAIGGARSAQASGDCSDFYTAVGNSISFEPAVGSVKFTTPRFHARFRQPGVIGSGIDVTGPEGTIPQVAFSDSCTSADLGFVEDPRQAPPVQYSIEVTLPNSPVNSHDSLSNTPQSSN